MEVVDDRMNVIIAPGTPEGHAIVEEDEGDQDPDWVPGDLIFRVTSVPHRVFTRRGNNLYMRKSITLKEVFLGTCIFLSSSHMVYTGFVRLYQGGAPLGQAAGDDGAQRHGHRTRPCTAYRQQGHAHFTYP